jgi:photosystem II stability/assembly factor-like uncharacterized protein
MRRIILSKIWLGLGVTVICLLVLSYLLNGYSHAKWKVLTEGKHSHIVPFNSITFFDSSNGLGIDVVSIEKTTDGGKTWVTILDYNDMGFYSLVFTNQKNGWIVGTESKILDSEEENRVASSKNHKPVILKTEDGGLNWHKVSVDEGSLTKKDARFSAFLDICFDKSGKSWIVGDGGIVEAMIESETLKISSVIFTENTLNNVSCSESGEVWAVGDNGLVMHLQNNSWTKKNLNNDAFLKKVKVVGNNVWLVGSARSKEETQVRGILLRSRDNGQTWEDKTPASANGLFDLYLNESQGWLVGASGTILHTNDGGQTWQREKSPTDNDLVTIFFLNPNQGWIGGSKRTVLRLSN